MPIPNTVDRTPWDDRTCAAACPLASATAGGEVGRRMFLAQAAAAAAALALAACGGGGGDEPTAPSSVGASLTLANYPTLANVGGIALVTLNGADLAIVPTDASTFIALSRVCQHAHGEVNPNASGGFTCPVHGAQFALDGRWVGGQRTTSLPAYATTYDAAAGTLHIG